VAEAFSPRFREANERLLAAGIAIGKRLGKRGGRETR
jgi:hypothetical protein